MIITKRDLITIQLGGLDADEITSQIDEAYGIPHIPTITRVKSVMSAPPPNAEFWQFKGYNDQMEIVPGILYSGFTSELLREDFWAFDCPLNKVRSDGKLLTIWDTNMYCSGELYPPENFAAFGLSIILQASERDAQNFSENVLVEFVYLGKLFVRTPASRITNIAAIGSIVSRDNRSPSSMIPSQMMRFDPPKIINALEEFRVTLRNESKANLGSFSGHVMLDGYYAVGVC